MKLKRLLFLFVFAAFPSFAAYQQQGFAQFQELDGNMNFVCTGQCFVLIGPLAGSDSISLNGDLQWSWLVWYGFLVGQQIAPGETIQIHGYSAINQQFSFAKLPFYSQLPKESQVILMVQGLITWNHIAATMWFMDAYQKIGQWWKDFWQMEPLTPYSINLRYGVKILWTSVLQYAYWIFFFAALYILFFVKWDKHTKFRKIFFWWIGIFLFIWARNIITYVGIVNQWIQTYTYPAMENKLFFDLWDYISFTDKIRKELKLDTEKTSCKIFVDSFQDWPFTSHWTSLYLKPCTIVLTWSEADYSIYYKKPIASGDLQKTVLIHFNGSYLLLHKSSTSLGKDNLVNLSGMSSSSFIK